MSSGIERRECRRFEIDGAEVRYKKTGLLSWGKGFSKSYLLTGISKGGLSFYCNKKLSIGKNLMLQIRVPNEAPFILNSILMGQMIYPGIESMLTRVQFMPFGDGDGWNTLEALDILRALDEKYGG
jgi:hypothetical protein